ncbi:MAG: hypothetical protein LIP23_01605, partial [Planctomycetes bacterium]|nr:hypothetical protein [Planctomycetota bacterium]
PEPRAKRSRQNLAAAAAPAAHVCVSLPASLREGGFMIFPPWLVSNCRLFSTVTANLVNAFRNSLKRLDANRAMLKLISDT